MLAPGNPASAGSRPSQAIIRSNDLPKEAAGRRASGRPAIRPATSSACRGACQQDWRCRLRRWQTICCSGPWLSRPTTIRSMSSRNTRPALRRRATRVAAAMGTDAGFRRPRFCAAAWSGVPSSTRWMALGADGAGQQQAFAGALGTQSAGHPFEAFAAIAAAGPAVMVDQIRLAIANGKASLHGPQKGAHRWICWGETTTTHINAACPGVSPGNDAPYKDCASSMERDNALVCIAPMAERSFSGRWVQQHRRGLLR